MGKALKLTDITQSVLPNLFSLPKRGTRSLFQKKWHPLLQNTKCPGTDHRQRCQNTVHGHYLPGALDQLHTKSQHSYLPSPKDVYCQNFKKATSEKSKAHAKLNLSGDHLAKMDTAPIILEIEAVLPNQICQDRKLLPPLASTNVSGTKGMRKALPCLGRCCVH